MLDVVIAPAKIAVMDGVKEIFSIPSDNYSLTETTKGMVFTFSTSYGGRAVAVYDLVRFSFTVMGHEYKRLAVITDRKKSKNDIYEFTAKDIASYYLNDSFIGDKDDILRTIATKVSIPVMAKLIFGYYTDLIQHVDPFHDVLIEGSRLLPKKKGKQTLNQYAILTALSKAIAEDQMYQVGIESLTNKDSIKGLESAFFGMAIISTESGIGLYDIRRSPRDRVFISPELINESLEVDSKPVGYTRARVMMNDGSTIEYVDTPSEMRLGRVINAPPISATKNLTVNQAYFTAMAKVLASRSSVTKFNVKSTAFLGAVPGITGVEYEDLVYQLSEVKIVVNNNVSVTGTLSYGNARLEEVLAELFMSR